MKPAGVALNVFDGRFATEPSQLSKGSDADGFPSAKMQVEQYGHQVEQPPQPEPARFQDFEQLPDL